MEPTSSIEFDFVEQVGGLSPNMRIRFYEVLEHNLTVGVRAIWSDDALIDSQKLERLKWLNEIMHRVVLKTAHLRLNRNEMSEADTWKMMEHYISICPEIAADIAMATIGSFRVVDRLGDAA